MDHPRSVVRRLHAVLVLGALLTIGLAAAAHAEPYGEIQRFGESGTSKGQLNEPEPAFGVDTENENVFAVDKSEEKLKGGEEVPVFRIQEFAKESKGKYKLLAFAKFKPTDSNTEEEEIGTVEGVAVDPARKRVYVLSDFERRAEPEVGVAAASAVYAFTINGETLEPVHQSGQPAGVLVGPSALQPESAATGVPLLEPRGIAVDPATGDVIMAGTETRENAAKELVKISVVQRIATGATPGPTARWVDSRTETNKSGELEEVSYFGYCEACANSPVVSSSGHIYVRGSSEPLVGFVSQISEIPLPESGNGSAVPTPVFSVATENNSLDQFTRGVLGPILPSEEVGGQLSINGSGGIYAASAIGNEENGGHTYEPGVTALSSTFHELGWTGGGNATQSHNCAVDQKGTLPYSLVAAGAGEDVFVLQRYEGEAKIIEFGPTSKSECPKGSAEAIETQEGEVKNPAELHEGEPVTLSSKLVRADALSVEWQFGDGSPADTITTPQAGASVAHHSFQKAGVLTVKEIIHTDDLASSELTVERTVNVVAGKPGVVTGKEPAVTSTSATLKGVVNPHEESLTKCEFEYGTTTQYGKTKSCKTLPNGKASEVEAVLAELAPGTIYHYRLVAGNRHGTAYGEDETFTTKSGPTPAVKTESASAIGQTAATLQAEVNPNGATLSKCYFEYGTSEAYGSTVACNPALPTAAGKVTAVATPLTANTKYYFRVVVEAEGSKVGGSPVALTTAAPPACVTNCGGGGGGGGGGNKPPEEGKGEVKRFVEASPTAMIAGTAAAVASNGAFTLKVSCPANTNCSGSITVKTLSAVVAKLAHAAKRKAKAAILTLATGSFAVSGGQSKTVTLHLSSKARALLARLHLLRARVTLVSSNASRATATTSATVALRPAKTAHRRKH